MKKNPWKCIRMCALWCAFLILGACAVVHKPPATKEPATYVVDPVHSSLVFRVKHLGITHIYGRFNNLVGTVTIDDQRPANSSLDLAVKTQDVDTGNTKRDDHLRSPDFFDAQRYPVISFKSTSFEKLGKDLYAVEGQLDLHGVRRPLTAKVRHTGAGRHPSGDHRIGFESSFTIKRSNFGMSYMLGGVSDDVLLIVTIQGIRK